MVDNVLDLSGFEGALRDGQFIHSDVQYKDRTALSQPLGSVIQSLVPIWVREFRLGP